MFTLHPLIDLTRILFTPEQRAITEVWWAVETIGFERASQLMYEADANPFMTPHDRAQLLIHEAYAIVHQRELERQRQAVEIARERAAAEAERRRRYASADLLLG